MCIRDRSTDRDELRVGHSLFIVVLESIRSEQNLILLLSVTKLDGLSVAVAHSQLLGTIRSLIDMDFANHAGSADKIIVNGAELLQVEMRPVSYTHL